MLKIGMIGADGGAKDGHALSTCKILNSGAYDASIVGLYGDNPEEAAALAAAQGIDFVADSPEALLGKVDAVFVMQRNGNRHLACALPFVSAGLPVFVDKPFTCTVEDAKRLVAAAQKSGSILCGGSYVKYAQAIRDIREAAQKEGHILSGYISFPFYLESPYGGMHFYSHHLIEEMLHAFGKDVQSVTTTMVGGHVVATAAYRDFPVIMNYSAGYDGLHAGIYLDDYTSFMRTVQISGFDTYQCEQFLQSARTGEGDESDLLLQAVIISNAIERSLQEKRTVMIEEVAR